MKDMLIYCTDPTARLGTIEVRAILATPCGAAEEPG
jgi:hypothetical protein